MDDKLIKDLIFPIIVVILMVLGKLFKPKGEEDDQPPPQETEDKTVRDIREEIRRKIAERARQAQEGQQPPPPPPPPQPPQPQQPRTYQHPSPLLPPRRIEPMPAPARMEAPPPLPAVPNLEAQLAEQKRLLEDSIRRAEEIRNRANLRGSTREININQGDLTAAAGREGGGAGGSRNHAVAREVILNLKDRRRLRAAFVTQEILRPPVSLRPAGQQNELAP